MTTQNGINPDLLKDSPNKYRHQNMTAIPKKREQLIPDNVAVSEKIVANL